MRKVVVIFFVFAMLLASTGIAQEPVRIVVENNSGATVFLPLPLNIVNAKGKSTFGPIFPAYDAKTPRLTYFSATILPDENDEINYNVIYNLVYDGKHFEPKTLGARVKSGDPTVQLVNGLKATITKVPEGDAEINVLKITIEKLLNEHTFVNKSKSSTVVTFVAGNYKGKKVVLEPGQNFSLFGEQVKFYLRKNINSSSDSVSELKDARNVKDLFVPSVVLNSSGRFEITDKTIDWLYNSSMNIDDRMVKFTMEFAIPQPNGMQIVSVDGKLKYVIDGAKPKFGQKPIVMPQGVKSIPMIIYIQSSNSWETGLLKISPKNGKIKLGPPVKDPEGTWVVTEAFQLSSKGSW